MLTIACCLVVGLGLRLDLMSGWLVVMRTYLYQFTLSLSLSPINVLYIIAISTFRRITVWKKYCDITSM